MSNQHPTYPLKINEQLGELILMPCPGTKELDLVASIEQLAQQGVHGIITMMPAHELHANQVGNIGEICQQQQIQWFHLPIEDDLAPDDTYINNWANMRAAIQQLLSNQQSVAVHCKGGTGRTGLIAAQILLELGWSLDDATLTIRELRPNALTMPSRIDYLQQLEQSIGK